MKLHMHKNDFSFTSFGLYSRSAAVPEKTLKTSASIYSINVDLTELLLCSAHVNLPGSGNLPSVYVTLRSTLVFGHCTAGVDR